MFIDEYPALHKKILERIARRKALKASQQAKHARPKRKKMNERQRFLRSPAWYEVRQIIFTRDGRVCAHCGSVERLQIDHIKPRSKFPELALEQTNLQVLCWPCNKKKATQH